MKKTAAMILTMIFLHALHSTTSAQTPQTLKGTWAVDIKATEKLLKNSPPPTQDLQWISLSSGLMFQMTYEFTDNAIAVSAYTSEKKILYRLLSGQDNKLRYVSEIKQADRDDIWTVNIISDENISISSSQSPATKYFLLKRVKLDPTMRAEDTKRAFEAWKDWAKVLAPVLAPKAKAENPKTPLWEAIANRDVEKAKALILSGADVNFADQQGNSILHHVLHLRNAELIELLITKGANVDTHNIQGETPLHWVARGGMSATDKATILKMAEALIAHRADVNTVSPAYGTPLNIAAYANNIQMAKLLIAHGADVEGKGASPLSSAGVNGDYVEMAQLLVDSGAGVNTQTANGSYPLHAAAFHEKVTTFLLSRGANPNILDAKGFTPLYMAAGSDYGAASAEALLNHGADPNARNPNGLTALHQAAAQGAIKIIEVLVAHKADTNAIDDAGYTPLHGAIRYGIGKGGIGVVEVLAKHGANANIQNGPDGKTLLHEAISEDKIDIIQLLLSHGADVNAVSKHGATSLHFAASQGTTKIAELLLANNADLNARDSWGNTPLHNAIRSGLRTQGIGIIQVLVKRGANINTKNDRDGKTPFHVAVSKGDVEVVRLLLSHGADVNARDKYGATSLHSAASEGTTKIAELLLANKADINARDSFGNTPLHNAILSGLHIEGIGIIETLIKQGANINAKNDNGETLLHLGISEGDAEVVQLLLSHGADVNVTTKHGATSLNLARNSTAITQLLQKHGAR